MPYLASTLQKFNNLEFKIFENTKLSTKIYGPNENTHKREKQTRQSRLKSALFTGLAQRMEV